MLFLLLAIFGRAGLLGNYVHSLIKLLFGDTLFLLPLLCFFAAITFFASFRPNLLATNLIGGLLVFFSGLALAEIIFGEKTGGYIGFGLAFPFLKLIDYWATLVLFLLLFLTGVLVMFNIHFSPSFLKGIFGGRNYQERDRCRICPWFHGSHLYDGVRTGSGKTRS